MKNRLREVRKEQGLSVKQVSELSNLDKSTIYHYENGRRKPDIDTVNKLCKIYECSISRLYPDFFEREIIPSYRVLETAVNFANTVCSVSGTSMKQQYPKLWQKLMEVANIEDLEEAIKFKKDEQIREHQEYVKWQDQQDDYGEHEWEYSEPGYEEDWSDEEN